MRRYSRIGLIGLAIGLSAPAVAEPPRLSLPVACDVGRLCFLQTYPDQDPTDAYQDYLCGKRAYDGHGGTDIRVPTLAEMDLEVAVIAAADGVVVGTRDAMEDGFLDEIGADVIGEREAGNGVAIDHGDGWVTQYSHLKKGSVRVRTGDRVKRGEPLGAIGLSGKTVFPHLHLSVYHRRERIDPFTGGPTNLGCGDEIAPLWQEPAFEILHDVAGGLMKAGFASRPLTSREVVANRLQDASFDRQSKALVFWTLSYNLRAGDLEYLGLFGSDGRLLAEKSQQVPRAKAQRFLFIGKKGGPWEGGRYMGLYQLSRPNEEGELELLQEERFPLLLEQ